MSFYLFCSCVLAGLTTVAILTDKFYPKMMIHMQNLPAILAKAVTPAIAVMRIWLTLSADGQCVSTGIAKPQGQIALIGDCVELCHSHLSVVPVFTFYEAWVRYGQHCQDCNLSKM